MRFPLPVPLLALLCAASPGVRAQEVSVPTAAASVLRPTTLPPDPGALTAPGAQVNGAALAGLPRMNRLIIEQILPAMPQGGGYNARQPALDKLAASVRAVGPVLLVQPEAAKPSFCSGATYLVFLKALNALPSPDERPRDAALNALLINHQRDGEGVWGRWNANGPGTARLFHELNLGRNFSDFNAALPGDFMKVFWTPEVGRREHGHSVIFLGRVAGPDGKEFVRFWSSNTDKGYGQRLVPREKISHAIFSRLETPANLANAPRLPAIDPYLGSLLRVDSSAAEARRQCGL